jgi:hypothetical protein
MSTSTATVRFSHLVDADGWTEFDPNRLGMQPLPVERAAVLVELQSDKRGFPNPIAVGYLKFSAGEKDSPFFVIPGLGGQVLRWKPIPRERTTALTSADLN